MEWIQFRAMSTDVLVAGQGPLAQDGMRAARAYIEAGERRFSRFQPESELSRLNRSAGRWFTASVEMVQLLQKALYFHGLTGGVFDPSVLPDLIRLGYDRSIDEIRARPGMVPAAASAREPRPGLDEMELDEGSRRVRLPKGLQLDFGGIAKGWIVDGAAALLGRYCDACAVNAGGDMRFIGHAPLGLGWPVELEDPRDASHSIARLTLSDGAVATSSVAKRSWKQGGSTRHHLIDPRTGEPARSEWLCATAIAADAVTAEVYAKALLIGPGAGLAELAARNNIVYLLVDRKGNLHGSPHSQELVHEHEFIRQ
ncbi:MAG TPA: FAD:protein FMN transferase [Anaerolineales bacterium]|nr:FAD:protein FMN transferase [Anaerolineales bacterium]